jgi:hypothetical protein
VSALCDAAESLSGLSRFRDGFDATTFPRPNAVCSPDRGLHYAPCRCDGDRKVMCRAGSSSG